MKPSPTSLSFSEFFDLWIWLATIICFFSIVICTLLFITDKEHKEGIKDYIHNLSNLDTNNVHIFDIIIAGFFLLSFIIFHAKVILVDNKVDLVSLLIHFFGFLSTDYLYSRLIFKRRVSAPSPTPQSETFYSDNTSSNFYEEDEPDHQDYAFDASRFQSKKDEQRYEKYKNMANSPTASAGERETAMRKMIALDKKSKD